MLFNLSQFKEPLLFEGAMGTNLLASGASGCLEVLNLDNPSLVQGIHKSFLEKGCRLIKTNTFCANRPLLDAHHLAHQVYEINYQGAKLARSVADNYQAYVAGSMGPGRLLPSLGQIQPYQLSEFYREQSTALMAGQVDCLLLETCFDIQQVLAALEGIQSAFQESQRKIPILVSFFIPSSGLLIGDLPFEQVLAQLPLDKIHALGLNCMAIDDPLLMQGLKTLNQFSSLPLFCCPNAGLPQTIDGQLVYPLSPQDYLSHWQTLHRAIPDCLWGGCCGTTPEYLDYPALLLQEAEPNQV